MTGELYLALCINKRILRILALFMLPAGYPNVIFWRVSGVCAAAVLEGVFVENAQGADMMVASFNELQLMTFRNRRRRQLRLSCGIE